MKTELFKNWKQVQLGEIAEFINGRAFKPNEWETTGKKIIRIQDLTSSTNLSNYTTKTFEDKYLVKKDDLLVSWSATLDAFIWNQEEGWLNQHIFKVNENKNIVDRKFLFYLIKSRINDFKKQTHGSTMKHITKDKFNAIKLSLPPLNTQQKIASTLAKVEKLRELRMQADKLTKDYLKAVFLEMFGDPHRGQWKKQPLSKFGNIVTGNTPSRRNKENYGNYIDWIKSDNLHTSSAFISRSSECLSDIGAKKGRVVPKGAVLVTCIAGSISSIGNTAIADKDVAFNQQINAIIPNEDVDSFFLYHLIKNSQKIIQGSATKSLKGIVSKSKFSSIELPLPPISIQKQFSKIADKIEKTRKYQKQSKEEIENLLNKIMQKAFNGELVC